MNNGRIVIITGGAGGIGSKIVDRFVRNGDQVIAIDRDAKALKHLQESPGISNGKSISRQ